MGTSAKMLARIFGLVAFGALIAAALFGGAFAQASVPAGVPAGIPASKIDGQVIKDTANGRKTSFMILLADQADVSAAYNMKDQDARGWYVYNTLRDKAAATQAPIRAMLAQAGASYQPFWVANMIATTGDLNLVQALAARPDVKVIESNDSFKGVEDPAIANYQPAPASPDTVEWGVQNVNAPAVWALGYTGQGIVIANEDTGMRWTQNAIKPKYRGWNGTMADHNYNWWDAIHDSVGNVCGNNSQQPCDDQGHGTHTTGTTVGDDGAGNQIGVAPGAKWIGCRNMDANNGTPARYSECFQFFIAPTDLGGNNPNPTLRPHVVNNSWECPSSEGCAPNSLETIVNNTQAAGIFVEASAQNSGPGCSSVQNPIAIYSASFSTGAIDINNNLASFSSRGPSLYYNPPLLKPNISAPGVNVRSSYFSNDSSYASLSGTSMAGPHVVGVVALLWSARPQLSRDITTTKTILQNTANPGVVVAAQTCGGIPSSQIPNNSFGYGRVDALAAVNSVQQGTPTPTTTGTIATATRTATGTNTPTATATPCSTGAVTNGGFETGQLAPWVVLGTNPPPVVSNAQPHSGTYSALLGTVSGTEPNGDGSMYQTITVPASGGTLSYWWNGGTTDTITFDWQDAYVTNTSGTILATIQHQCATTTGWQNQTFNMAPYAGQTVRIEFLVHQDGFGDDTYMYVDDVALLTACSTGTPATNTPTRTATSPAATATNPAATSTQPAATATSPVATATSPAATSTAGANTATRTPLATSPAGSATSTSTSIPGTPTATYTACPIQFTDVPNGSTFYPYIRCLACRGIVSGYADGTFRPNNNVTRGQLSKIVANSAGFNETHTTQDFQDVPVGSNFYIWIERLYSRGIIGGYPCGGPFEPCGPGNLPYFRPNANATRGQITKIDANAAGYNDPPVGQQFQDVAPGSTFYTYTYQLVTRGIMSGYPCSGPGEPCVPPGNLPYFRPNNNATRGQTSKIVANTFFPNCQTPQGVKR